MASRAHPTNTQVLVNIGTVCLMSNDLVRARQAFEAALDVDPDDYQTLFNLGSHLWRSGRREQARPHLEAYLRAAPPALEARDIARVRKLLE